MNQIKQHSANGKKWTIVQVPKGANYIHIDNETTGPVLRYDVETFSNATIALPPGQYRLHCVAEQATQNQASEVVDGNLGELKDTGFTLKPLFDLFEKTILLMATVRQLFPDNHQNFNHLIIEIL